MIAGKRYSVLDGLRGLVALAVVFGHSTEQLLGHSFNTNYTSAVPFFFVLSGFVLEHVYGENLRSGASKSDYIAHRLIRLYPMLVFSGMFAGAVLLIRWWAGQVVSPQNSAIVFGVLSGITTIPSPSLSIEAWRWPSNHPVWSLFFELVASGIFGAFVYSFKTSIFLFIVITSMIVLLGMEHQSHVIAKGLIGQATLTLFAFSLGILIRRRLYLWPTFSLTINIMVVAAFILYILMPMRLPNYINFTLLITLIPSTIMAASKIPTYGGFHSVCDLSGRLSYPIYILHWPIMVVVKGITDNESGMLTVWTVITITILVSLAIYTYLDQPVRAALSRMWHRR